MLRDVIFDDPDIVAYVPFDHVSDLLHWHKAVAFAPKLAFFNQPIVQLNLLKRS